MVFLSAFCYSLTTGATLFGERGDFLNFEEKSYMPEVLEYVPELQLYVPVPWFVFASHTTRLQARIAGVHARIIFVSEPFWEVSEFIRA